MDLFVGATVTQTYIWVFQLAVIKTQKKKIETVPTRFIEDKNVLKPKLHHISKRD